MWFRGPRGGYVTPIQIVRSLAQVVRNTEAGACPGRAGSIRLWYWEADDQAGRSALSITEALSGEGTSHFRRRAWVLAPCPRREYRDFTLEFVQLPPRSSPDRGACGHQPIFRTGRRCEATTHRIRERGRAGTAFPGAHRRAGPAGAREDHPVVSVAAQTPVESGR